MKFACLRRYEIRQPLESLETCSNFYRKVETSRSNCLLVLLLKVLSAKCIVSSNDLLLVIRICNRTYVGSHIS